MSTYDDDRIDLSALAGFRDRASRDAAVARVLARLEPELARRARELTPFGLLAAWARPALASAAALAAVALLALGTLDRDAPVPAGVADAFELPAPAMALLDDEAPRLAELVLETEAD